MAIDPSMALGGGEWQIKGAKSLTDADGTVRANDAQGPGFGKMLSNSLASLTATQTEAAGASQAFAAGAVTDPTQVVMAVERARLSMQMASQVRSKAVEAYQDIFHTQV